MTADELCTQLIAWASNRESPWPGEPPVFLWERWIREDPERAWAVLESLVRRAPRDVEAMSVAAYRVSLLLARDFHRFRERAVALLEASSCLDALLGPEVFVEAEYLPRAIEPEQLAREWLRYQRNDDRAKWPEPLDRKDPELRLRLAVAIIEGGPHAGLDIDEVDGPLLDVVLEFRERVIEAIEKTARRSAGLRLAIWSLRHQRWGHGFRPDFPLELWARFQAAAGETNPCNTRQPERDASELAPLEQEYVAAWLAREVTSWAWSSLSDLVRVEPERAWETVVATVRNSRTAEERAVCGAGPLEDLIRDHPALFIERAEDLAFRDLDFRQALGAAWITLEDVPAPLARRYVIASGRELKVLDAPEDWKPDAGGNDS